MSAAVYRFVFNQDVSLVEVEQTLLLASFAGEGLFGAARVRLEFDYFVDEPRRTIIVDGTTEVGSAIVRLFTGLVLREFDEQAFQVRRAETCYAHPSATSDSRPAEA